MEYKLSCYVRHVRRKWSLSQPEIAELLGIGDKHLSHIERRGFGMSARVLIAFEIVFGRRAADLFPALYDETEDTVVRNLYVFQQKLEDKSSLRAAKKRVFVDRALNKVIKNTITPKEHES
mgnify:CR=1 FL=1